MSVNRRRELSRTDLADSLDSVQQPMSQTQMNRANPAAWQRMFIAIRALFVKAAGAVKTAYRD